MEQLHQSVMSDPSSVIIDESSDIESLVQKLPSARAVIIVGEVADSSVVDWMLSMAKGHSFDPFLHRKILAQVLAENPELRPSSMEDIKSLFSELDKHTPFRRSPPAP